MVPRSLAAGAFFLACCTAPLPAAEKPSFNRDIRPLLSDACFQCHGTDEAKRKGNLRLDVRELAIKPAKSGSPAIVPGKPDESELIKRVAAHDESAMPPKKLGKTLRAEQVELLKRWIADGAAYEGHWAFQTVRRPSPPADGHAIDAFVRAKLAAE